jgi:hypothetical protein
VSTEQQQAAEAVETNEETTEHQEAVADQFAEADDKADPAPSLSIEDIAARGGWVPQDKFKGPAEKWKPADQFLLDGHEIKDRVSRELKGLRETVETIKSTNSTILQDRLAEQHAELSRQYAAAVEKGDPDAAWRAANGIRDLQSKASPQPSAPAPETEAWVAKNQKVKADPVAWQRALAINEAYIKSYPNSAVGEQLAYVEANMKREFPHLFDDKPAPQVSNPSTRSTAGAPRGKTVADLPKEARAIADDMVERGLIPNADHYAKNYFAEIEKRKQHG